MSTMLSGCGRAAALLFFISSLGAEPARAQQPDLVVASFDDGKVETVPGLALIVLSDEQLGGTSTANLTLVNPGAKGSKGALRIGFRITADFPAPFDGVWALLGKDGMPMDASAYRGVRFHARATAGTFLAGVGQTGGSGSFYLAPFDVKPEWTVVELPFDKFRKTPPPGAPPGEPTPLVPTNIVSVAFNVASQLRGQFDLEIDQVELYR